MTTWLWVGDARGVRAHAVRADDEELSALATALQTTLAAMRTLHFDAETIHQVRGSALGARARVRERLYRCSACCKAFCISATSTSRPLCPVGAFARLFPPSLTCVQTAPAIL